MSNLDIPGGDQPRRVPDLTPSPDTAWPKMEQKPKTIGWHWHRWTLWGPKYTQRGRGMVAAIGETHPVWWQERNCIHCNMIQERIVGLD